MGQGGKSGFELMLEAEEIDHLMSGPEVPEWLEAEGEVSRAGTAVAVDDLLSERRGEC